MKVVVKYQLSAWVQNPIEMPQNAEMLSCGWEGMAPVLWAFIDQNLPTVKRLIVIIPTDQPCYFPEIYHFVGSVEAPGTGTRFHVFDLGETPITPTSAGTPES